MRWNRFIVSALLPLSRSSPPFFPCSFSLSVALSLSRTCNVNLCYFAQSSVTLLNLQHLELKLLHRHLPLHDDPLGVTGKEKQRGSNIFLQCNTVLFGKDTRFLRKSETLSLTKIQKIMRKDELKFSKEQIFVVVCYWRDRSGEVPTLPRHLPVSSGSCKRPLFLLPACSVEGKVEIGMERWR